MPQCLWPDGSITSDSFDIMRELERRYPTETALPHDDDQTRLERLFLAYALARTGPGKKLAFLVEWMRMPSGRGASFASSFRALMFLYFFCLIAFGRRAMRARKQNPDTFHSLVKALKSWSEKLERQDFLAGSDPGGIDYALYGHVQCMVSGLTDETISVLTTDPHIHNWILRMRDRFPVYSSDFTKRFTKPAYVPKRASGADQLVFGLTLALSVACFPLTLLFLIDAFRRRGKNPARTGARLP